MHTNTPTHTHRSEAVEVFSTIPEQSSEVKAAAAARQTADVRAHSENYPCYGIHLLFL